jgi:hypothetical protein
MLKFFILLTILGWVATLAFAIYLVNRRKREQKEIIDSHGFEVIPTDDGDKGAP